MQGEKESKAWKERDENLWGDWRTEGGKKEVGLARTTQRVERARSHPSGRERNGEREMQRDGKSGREEQTEGEKQRGEWGGWIFPLQDFVSVAQWSFSSSGKTFPLSPFSCLFLPLHSSLTQFFSLSQFTSLSLCKLVFSYALCLHQFLWSLSLSDFSVALSLYDLSYPSLPSLSVSPSLPLILSSLISALLSMASTLCVPPPIVFRLCSPRMHLFKACFTKTVLKQRQWGEGEMAVAVMFDSFLMVVLELMREQAAVVTLSAFICCSSSCLTWWWWCWMMMFMQSRWKNKKSRFILLVKLLQKYGFWSIEEEVTSLLTA